MKIKDSIKYRKFIILLWTILSLFALIKMLNLVKPLEAVFLLILYLIPLLTSSIILCDHLLPKAMKNKRMKAFIIYFSLLTLTTAILMTQSVYVFEYLTKIGVFKSTFVSAPYNTFWGIFADQLFAAMIINLSFCGIRFYYEHRKLENMLLESQLHTLKSQINPHFMFNVLNHIHYYVEKKDDLATVLLLKYSEILRYQLYSGNKNTIELKEEINFLKNFIDIETIRWEDKLDIHCFWEIENEKKQLPSLLLIPLIENAFKHVSRSSKGKGYINIRLTQNGNTICLDVENSKPMIEIKKNNNSGLGLENLRNRLDILHNGKHKLEIEETEAVYHTKLTIQL